MRAGLARDDDYVTLGKPPCDWDDPAAREALVDALVRDAHAALAALHGHELTGPVAEAAQLLALVVGQDVEAEEDGVFRIARKVRLSSFLCKQLLILWLGAGFLRLGWCAGARRGQAWSASTVGLEC